MSNESSKVLCTLFGPVVSALASHPGATVEKNVGGSSHERRLAKHARTLLKGNGGYSRTPGDPGDGQRNGDPTVPARGAAGPGDFDSLAFDEAARDETGGQQQAQERLNRNLASLMASCGAAPPASSTPTTKARKTSGPAIKPVITASFQPGDHVVQRAAPGVSSVVVKSYGHGKGQVLLCDYAGDGSDCAWHVPSQLQPA